MSIQAKGLCSERHYMGSSASGRYLANPDARPNLTTLPDFIKAPHDPRVRAAWATRYLRDMGVLDLVLQCEACKALLRSGDESITARGYDPAEVLAYRQETSRQLRLIGVSPKGQSEIFRRYREIAGRN